MTHSQLIALSPIEIVAISTIATMLAIAIKRSHALVATICLAGLTAALASLVVVWPGLTVRQSDPSLLAVDPFACFYMAVILIAALAAAALSYPYLESHRVRREEMYLLLQLSSLGCLVLAASRHFASFFVGLELLSMPMYGMAAYLVNERRSLEAGMKYLVLSAVASAFIVFGMALVYSQTGTMTFSRIGANTSIYDGGHLLIVLGGSLLLVGIGFKMSLAPFHLWTPDVYEGAPAPVASFLGTASKIAVFALLLRYFVEARAYQYGALVDALSGLALLSIALGNLLALRQANLKRLLAYSAIAHFGYVLVALIASGPLASEAAAVYLLTYSIATLAAFGVITVISTPKGGSETQALPDYRGLFWEHPALAAILSLALLSLAGIPLTPGFLGKFYVLGAGVDGRRWLLLSAIVVGSAIGLYYYLRALVQLYLRPASDAATRRFSWTQGPAGGALIALLLAMFALGFYPAPFIRLARASGIERTQSRPPAVATNRSAVLAQERIGH